MKKGITPFVEAIFLIVIAVAVSTVIAGWLSTLSTERSEAITNSTKTQLHCQFGSLYIKSASYNCSGSCAAGTAHNLTATVVNSGKISVNINKIFVQNTTGTVFSFDLNETTLIDPGTTKVVTNISTESCSGINRTIDKVVVNSIECPSTAFDSMPGGDVTYVSC